MSEQDTSADHRVCARCKRSKPIALFPYRQRKKGFEAPTRIGTCEPCQAAKKNERTEKAREKQGTDGNKENVDPAGDEEIGGGVGLSKLALEEFLSFIGGQLGSIELEASVDISSMAKLVSRRGKADALALAVWEAMNLRFVYVLFNCKPLTSFLPHKPGTTASMITRSRKIQRAIITIAPSTTSDSTSPRKSARPKSSATKSRC